MAIKTRETTATGVTNKGSPLTNAELDNNFVELQQNKIELDDLSVGAESDPSGDGSVAYDNTTGVFTYTPPADISGAVTFAASAGEALAKGDVVYVSGISGNKPVVSKADADDASKMPAFGLAETAANLNANVNIITFGTIYDLDTSGFGAGDTVFVSTTAGALTNSAPTGESSLLQNMGKVMRSDASAGSIKVGGAGRTNATPNLNDGNVFIGNSSNQSEARALAAGDVASGTFADARIAESNVTQHEAALSVTASQLSDVTSSAAELNLVDGSTADTVVNSKAVIYGSAGQITANELDVDNIQIDANAVKSTNTNGNIQLFPNGTGFTELYGNTNAGAIRFNCEVNTHGVTLKGPPHSAGATYSLELPDADGTSGQVLQTDGSGKLSFADTAGGGGGSLEATASGALANGDLVIVNSDGTVSVVAETIDNTPSAGTSAVFESATSTYISAVYDANAQKVVIAYRDEGNSFYGTAIVGTVSGTSISFGTPVVFESASSDYISAAYDANAQKVVIAYRDQGNSFYGTAIVGTVSGTSISFGSPVVFESASPIYISAVYDANAQKVVIAYRDEGNSFYGTAIVGTVSGTSISFGTAVVFESASSYWTSATYDANAQKVVIAYRDLGNSSYGTAIVGTVSGTSISFGTPVVFESASSVDISAAYDANAQKVVIAYRDAGNSNYGTAIVGTVSGTSISFGTAVVFESAASTYISATYDANAQKVVIAYRDIGNSNYGTAVVGTVSGTSISFGTAVVFESANSSYISAAYDANAQKVVIAYRDEGNSDYGTGVVFSNQSVTTNLTAENYIGISDAAYADAATATIQIVGSVDDAQSGLTAGQQYFVQVDGTLGLTADDPSVVAGTAVSSTKIIVKG